MDPQLFEILETGDPDDEVRAIVRLHDPAVTPPGVRFVARFAEIATCRLRRGDIPRIRAHENVASLKAPDAIVPEHVVAVGAPLTAEASDERRPRDVAATGRGVVVGF